MNYKRAKKLSQKQLAEQHWKPSWITAAFLLIAIALIVLSMKLCGYLDYVENIYTNFMAESASIADALTEQSDPTVMYDELYGAMDAALTETPLPDVPVTGVLLAWAVLLMLPVFRAGHTGYCLKAARNEAAGLRSLFDGFRHFFRALGLYLVRMVLTGAGLCFFVLPGLYLWYRYRFAGFVLADHPEYSVFRILRESAKLSRGLIGALFVLELSFVVWYIASYVITMLVSLPVAEVYYRPVCKMARAQYYMEALKDTEAWREDKHDGQ